MRVAGVESKRAPREYGRGARSGSDPATHIGKVKFDKSAQAYLVQVSVPVIDAGAAIGALTIGVNLDELDKAGK